MCGIFGVISKSTVSPRHLRALASHARQRGRDSSGLLCLAPESGHVYRADHEVTSLLRLARYRGCKAVIGHSRLITNGFRDNQPVFRDGVCVFHNGVIVNHVETWGKIGDTPRQQIDTEIIAAIASRHLADGGDVAGIAEKVIGLCDGVVACALALPSLGKLCLFSNNGSLYAGRMGGAFLFSSEAHPLRLMACQEVRQVRQGEVIDIPTVGQPLHFTDVRRHRRDLVPAVLSRSAAEERMLASPRHELRRCTRCILPHTMPFIEFDLKGVCNFCRHYRSRNVPRPKDELFRLVEPYRRNGGSECIIPFSGGRDSCYGLHLVVKELGLRPIAYTYDWGMVTDLGRRNISRMCARLGVENIIVADDISQKRRFIRWNLETWLRSPHLGMVSILTAGDKHFFRHVETVKRQTGVSLNLWGVNPLEVTHFKAGFLGIPPDFKEKRVYSHGLAKQLRYQCLRLREMVRNPGYFNRSLWDTLSGEYFRSFTEKRDYFHIFDYWRWDESVVEATLSDYDWERAPDTNATWRIGDGTAAFYNYVYFTVAGFSEHDTFRSNQIREGDMSRDAALRLVADENRPRYPNIKWYLDAVGVDFARAVSAVNAIPRLA